jgi:hypothetical protein
VLWQVLKFAVGGLNCLRKRVRGFREYFNGGLYASQRHGQRMQRFVRKSLINGSPAAPPSKATETPLYH